MIRALKKNEAGEQGSELDTVHGKDLSEEVTFQKSQQIEDMSPKKIWKKKVPGRGNSECKGPGVGTSLACSGNSKNASIARMIE